MISGRRLTTQAAALSDCGCFLLRSVCGYPPHQRYPEFSRLSLGYLASARRSLASLLASAFTVRICSRSARVSRRQCRQISLWWPSSARRLSICSSLWAESAPQPPRAHNRLINRFVHNSNGRALSVSSISICCSMSKRSLQRRAAGSSISRSATTRASSTRGSWRFPPS